MCKPASTGEAFTLDKPYKLGYQPVVWHLPGVGASLFGGAYAGGKPRNAAKFLFFYYTKHVMQSQICLTLHNFFLLHNKQLKFRI